MLKTIAAAVTCAILAGLAAPASAAEPPVPMTFMKDGDIWLSTGAETYRVTYDGDNSWPRLSPDHTQIAYVHDRDIWIAYVGSGADFVSTYPVTNSHDTGAASWSPHGDYLAYRAGSIFTGSLFTVRVSATPREVMPGPISGPAAGTPVELHRMMHELRQAHTVTWSRDGKSIAFAGGECWGIYDDCLTVLDLASNVEKTVAAFAGGGRERSGFATTPAFSQDSAKLFWTQQIEDGPLKIMGYHRTDGNRWQVGKDGDAMPVAMGHGRFLVVAATGWITFVTSKGRQPLLEGTQPDWRPLGVSHRQLG